uniref:Uncharacterized protein n=1 Tax=Pyramimonas obovata TaxID=1411642 RepID=A0A7S0WJB1_9CHLO|mmetsp:Transcript_27283/g.59569  ORF Transcript_27283/g.59569 Transcript_27283/m.59569 type:complete len:426 (+) Transcript_27283:167-1444(+)
MMESLLQRSAFGSFPTADVSRHQANPCRVKAQPVPKTMGAKGFGAKPAPKQPEPKRGKSVVQKKVQANNTATTKKAVDSALEMLSKEDTKDKVGPAVPQHPDSKWIPKVNPEDAAKGRLDYVTVEEWGNLNSDADLDDLKVKSFSSAYDPADHSRPFYEQLCLHLQLLESKGELKVAQDKSKPLPPFEKWSFGRQTYMQYISDQYTVHEALEDAIFDASGGADQARPGGVNLIVAHRPAPPLPGVGGKVQAALRDVAALGLERCLMLGDDILALCANEAEAEGSGRSAEEVLEELQPGRNASSYAEYIRGLGRKVKDSEVGADEAAEAASELLANWFVVQVSHLTTIMRVGAKATEALGLFPMGAVNYYQTYPEGVEDPLETFREGVDSAGVALGADEAREEVREHLAKAMQKNSILLSTLAVVE